MYKPKRIEKRWGFELWMANNEENNYCGKILCILAGQSTSMHYHLEKHETFYVLDGILKLELLNTGDGKMETLTLKEGETYEIDRGQPHRLSAYTPEWMQPKENTRIIETSTFHKDEDSYRMWK